MPQEFWANAIFSLVPTILVGLVFWLILRQVFRADRNERAVQAKYEAEVRAELEAEDRARQEGATPAA